MNSIDVTVQDVETFEEKPSEELVKEDMKEVEEAT